jgi:hypothetical protein
MQEEQGEKNQRRRTGMMSKYVAYVNLGVTVFPKNNTEHVDSRSMAENG